MILALALIGGDPQSLTVASLLVIFLYALIKMFSVIYNALRDWKLTKAEKQEIGSAFDALIDVFREDKDPPSEE